MMKIDLHLHSSERSNCAVATEEEQIESAIAFGMTGVAFTDHDRLVPRGQLEYLNAKYAPFRVFTGIEVRLCDTGEDILVIGIHDESLMNREWIYADLHAFTRKRNGFIALAHPYRYSDAVYADVERCAPDAIEIHSMNIGICDEPLIQRLADSVQAKTIACSDAHWHGHVGIYHIELPGDARNDAELLEALHAGRYNLARDAGRITSHNAGVEERENIIREYIRDGKTAKDYSRDTGNWEGQFKRVAMGKSYRI